jgi:hypothetical protein
MIPHRLAGLVGVMLLWAPISVTATSPPDSPGARQEAENLAKLPPLMSFSRVDHSGRKQKGRASYYAHHFTNRKMADGGRGETGCPAGGAPASRSGGSFDGCRICLYC